MITTQNVKARMEIKSDEFDYNFHVTEMTITRTARRATGRAKVKGLFADPTNDEGKLDATKGQQVSIYIKTDATSDSWQPDLTSRDSEGKKSDEKLFVGEIVNLKQNEKGVFILEAWDAERYLRNKTIKFNSENNVPAERVLIELLAEAFGKEDENGNLVKSEVATNENNVEPGPRTPYVDKSAFDGTAERPWRFGTNDKGLPVVNALNDIIDKTGTHAYVDRDGVFRVVKYPEHNTIIHPPITKYEGGDDNNNASRVIYNVSGSASRQGTAVSYTQTRISNSAIATIAPQNPSAPEKTFTDRNITTQEQADEAANREAVKQEQKRDLGNMTVVGGLYIDVYDEVKLPKFNQGQGISARPLPNFKTNELKEIDEVEYKLDASSGFRTKVMLRKGTDQIAESIEASGDGFEDRVKEEKEESSGDSSFLGNVVDFIQRGLFYGS